MTTIQTSTKTPARDKARLHPMDALGLLQADHDFVSQLFAEYATTRSSSNKEALISEICLALVVHGQIEEEIFYPALRAAMGNKLLMPGASVEHTGVKNLIAQLQVVEPHSEMFDATVKVLSEYVRHHVKEEQEDLFVKARASSLNLVELGTRLAARKAVLLAKAN